MEQYVHGSVGHEWSRQRLRSDDAGPALARGVLAASMADDYLQLEAVRNYVLYRAFNNLRRRTFVTLEERAGFAKSVMDQLRHEATRDDTRFRRLRQFSEGLVRRRTDGGNGRRGRRRI